MTDRPSPAPDIAKWARCDLAQLYSELSTSPEGLSSIEAARRLDAYGFNALPEEKKLPLSRKALAQFKNLFNVLLIVAGVLSFLTSSPQMGFAILGVVVVAVLFSLFQEYRAERAVQALRQLVPENVKVLRDGSIKQVPASHVTRGDVVSLEEGDKVPADARLVTAFELDVDNSTLTGESEPQRRSAVAPTEAFEGPVTECPNLVFAGTVVASGTGTAVVLATGSETRFGQVVAITEAVQEPLSPLQRELDHAARLNFYVAIGLGLIFLAVVLAFLHLQVSDGILFMIGVMTSLVPEGLQITVTLALALSSLTLSKRNVVVKRLSSVETLGSTTVVCVDKTGTITEGQMTVRKIWMGGKTLDVTGEGYEPEGSILVDGRKVRGKDRPDLRALCEIAALNNKATLVPPLDRRKSRWTAVGDSTEAALLVLAAKAGMDPKKMLAEQPRIGLIPFESARKMMTSVHRDAKGASVAYVKGAGLEILSRSTTVQWGDAVVPMTEELSSSIRRQIDSFARDAYRVLALASGALVAPSDKYESAAVERDLTFVGLVAILDPPRADVPEAVYKARSAGLRIVMLTGDHELTAEAIARKVGIITAPDALVLTGYRVANMSDDEVAKALDTPEIVFARITPEQKLRIVQALKAKGETVAVTGDGVNDAPALREADIGIAMGITGTDVARESADMVLLDDNFASIVNGIEVGRSVFDNLKKFIVYVFSHNWAELVTFVAFVLVLTPATLPLTVVGILSIDLGMEIPPSLALTLEPPEPGIMDRPPRSRNSRLFDLATLVRSFYIGTLIGIAALFWCFAAWSQAGWTLGAYSVSNPTYVTGQTVVVAAIMAGQLGTLFATRTNVESAFSVSPLRNKWLIPAILAEIAILLTIVYVPFVESIFGMAPLAPAEWAFLYSLVPVILALEEARKLVVRRVILPTRAVPARPMAPAFAETEIIAAPGAEAAVRIPFVERGAPILMPVSLRPGETSALPIALGLAEYSGSRIVIARLPERDAKAAAWDAFRAQVQNLAAAAEIPCAYVDLQTRGPSRNARDLGRALKRLADQTGADTIVVPVEADALLGGGDPRLRTWLGDVADRRTILVRAAPDAATPRRGALRVLIPVLDEFHSEPFDVAASLTAFTRFPDVDVIAAKVIRLPPIVPMYSTYRPESLIDEERELAFLKGLRMRPIERLLSPKILMVREVGRDVVEFASDRKVDLILMAGDRSAARHGFLGREEREIARRSRCTVAVVVPRTGGST